MTHAAAADSRFAPTDRRFSPFRGVETFYGNIMALRGVDLEVSRRRDRRAHRGQWRRQIDLMMTICGVQRASSGEITFSGERINGLPAHRIARLGIAQSPEGRRIFPFMTVFENLQMGAAIDNFAHFENDLARVFKIFPRLSERRSQRGGTLSAASSKCSQSRGR